jgi:hypothetical protein
MSEARTIIDAFERFDVADFHHRDHVRLAWAYLREYELVEALVRFREALRKFAAHKGLPGLYHETITLMFLLLIRERCERHTSFEELEASSPELFNWKPSLVDRYYGEATLQSDRARAALVLPDLDAFPALR